MSTTTSTTTCTWKGASGRAYDFEMYPNGTVSRRYQCVYVLAALRSGSLYGLRIGVTNDIIRRLEEHGNDSTLMWCLHSRRWSHVGILVCEDEDERRRVENDLRANSSYSWPCDAMA